MEHQGHHNDDTRTTRALAPTTWLKWATLTERRQTPQEPPSAADIELRTKAGHRPGRISERRLLQGGLHHSHAAHREDTHTSGRPSGVSSAAGASSLDQWETHLALSGSYGASQFVSTKDSVWGWRPRIPGSQAPTEPECSELCSVLCGHGHPQRGPLPHQEEGAPRPSSPMDRGPLWEQNCA